MPLLAARDDCVKTTVVVVVECLQPTGVAARAGGFTATHSAVAYGSVAQRRALTSCVSYAGAGEVGEVRGGRGPHWKGRGHPSPWRRERRWRNLRAREMSE